MTHETKVARKLVEAYEVHQKHCQLCGDGKVCATGEALREDAFPQNDSVNGNQESAPERIRLFLHANGKLSERWYNAVVAPGPHEIIYVRDSVSPSEVEKLRAVEVELEAKLKEAEKNLS